MLWRGERCMRASLAAGLRGKASGGLSLPAVRWALDSFCTGSAQLSRPHAQTRLVPPPYCPHCPSSPQTLCTAWLRAPAGRAARWALKRCIRASFELVAPSCRTYTRDLFWCSHYACQQLPELQQLLRSALAQYVALASDSGAAAQFEAGGSSSCGSTAGSGQQSNAEPPQPLQQQPPQQQAAPGPVASVSEACSLATALADAVDDAFLEAMLAEVCAE